ncbi:VWA domain-containing protein [Sediminitomix flava]|uniref:VWA domain-containing protein n=1 Tax=Sediminitomix flava TaxID=379075 RepID=A0A315ZG24_SEDFL|nr:VWA domain-containing protein [Sediminitomix flava]PWJ44080.1 hypothetical protein BC781_101430 [Sediminitomix flava]
MNNLLTEYSIWFIPLCFLMGFALSYLLYRKNSPWSKKVNYSLMGVRTLLFTALFFLMLGPFVKLETQDYEKPVLVFAVDNSTSIPLVVDSVKISESLNSLDEIVEELKDEGYDIQFKNLEWDEELESAKEISFDKQQTNLHDLLEKVQNVYENRNLAGTVLLSDGIYNQGFSPEYSPYRMNIHTLAIGDTMSKADIKVKSILSNRVAYKDNKFPIVAEVENKGFENQSTKIELIHKGKVLDKKVVKFSKDEDIQQFEFLANATEKGTQHFKVRISALDEEFTAENNSKDLYIDILEGREKILLVASAPHPDIKALKSAIEKDKNLELIVWIPGMKALKPDFFDKEKFDLAILHQVPSIGGKGRDILDKIKKKNIPCWYILGSQSDFTYFQKSGTPIHLRTANRNFDKVTPSVNSNFSSFSMDEENKVLLGKLPPVNVPFGNIEVDKGSNVLLYQRVGNIVTKKPLLVVNEVQAEKSAVMLGEGLWMWRLHEYSLTQKHKAFDNLISKTVQYLSTKEDKRKFRVFTQEAEYLDSDDVHFDTEVYNDIYERVYGQTIELNIADENEQNYSYSYVNSKGSNRFTVKDLPQGIYTFTANSNLNGKTEIARGQFTVKSINLEASQTSANFNALKNISLQNNGEFHEVKDIEQLKTYLIQNKPADIIHTHEDFMEIIGLEWLLAVIVLLATMEWFTRKVQGGY